MNNPWKRILLLLPPLCLTLVLTAYGTHNAPIWADSPVLMAGAPAKPTIRTSGFLGGKNVTITAAGSDIYYTLDGAEPNVNAEPYIAPFPVTDTCTVRAIAVADGVSSAVARSQVSVTQVAPVTFSPPPGSPGLGAESVVGLDTETQNAVIYFTRDGSTPTTDSERYNRETGITLYDSVVLRAAAFLSGYRTSEVTEAAYDIALREENKAQVVVERKEDRDGEPIRDRDTVDIFVMVNTGERNPLDDSYDQATKITAAHLELDYDARVLAYNGCAAEEGQGVLQSNLFATESDGRIRIDVKDLQEPVEGGTLFSLQFTIRPNALERGVTRLILDPASTWIRGTSQITPDKDQPLTLEFQESDNGYIFISDTVNARVQRLTLTDADSQTITEVGDIAPGSVLHGEMNLSENVPPSQIRTADFVTASVFCVVYDTAGGMVNLQAWEADVSDPWNISMSGEVHVPEGVSVGTVKVIALSDELSPLCISGML